MSLPPRNGISFSQSVPLYLNELTECQTHTQTDHATCDVCGKEPHTQYEKVRWNNTHTHTPVERPFLGTTRVRRYPKGKTNLDFTEARDSEWQWHQLGRMQVCTLLQVDNHAITPTTLKQKQRYISE